MMWTRAQPKSRGLLPPSFPTESNRTDNSCRSGNAQIILGNLERAKDSNPRPNLGRLCFISRAGLNHELIGQKLELVATILLPNSKPHAGTEQKA